MAPPKILGKCSECDLPAQGLGYCPRHYQLYRRWGIPRRPSEEIVMQRRLWRHVQPEPNSGCWLWIGTLMEAGHGRMVFRGRLDGAHRVSWIAHRGPIPDGRIICHHCGVACCVNPDHLYPGTPASNAADMVRHGRSMRGEKNHKAKLTADQVIAIRADHRTKTAIAEDYGVTNQLVSAIKTRKIWRHVP